jgi:hypothetical protein
VNVEEKRIGVREKRVGVREKRVGVWAYGRIRRKRRGDRTIKQLKSRQFAPMRQGENLSFTLLYATSGFFAQYGIESHFKAFRQTVRQGGDVARPGLTECDDPAVQGMGSASNENWPQESTDR